MLFIKKLLDFSKPRFLKLDYIDIIIEEKTLFLVAWKSKRHHKVKIYPVNKIYYDHETAVVLKIPADTSEVTIILYSFWRKRKYRVFLKKVKLDKETAQHLITKFKPVEMLKLKTPVVNAVRTFRGMNLPVIVLKKQDFSINTPLIIINTDKLTYTIKTNYYE
jgi:hypothetical protein